jgi:hypothetical protein
VTIPALIGQLQQATQHLEQAKAMARDTLEELAEAEALIHSSLGSNAGPTMQPPAQSRQRLTGADRAARLLRDAPPRPGGSWRRRERRLAPAAGIPWSADRSTPTTPAHRRSKVPAPRTEPGLVATAAACHAKAKAFRPGTA